MKKFAGLLLATALVTTIVNAPSNVQAEELTGSNSSITQQLEELQKKNEAVKEVDMSSIKEEKQVKEEAPSEVKNDYSGLSVDLQAKFSKDDLRAEEEEKDITSTNDERRNAALEKEYDIEINASDHWSVNYDNYTPLTILKELGYYHINANRQTLISYALRTKDWQPYMAYEAEFSPLYFEIVDNKFVYSKIYYAHLLESHVTNHKFRLAAANGHVSDYYAPIEDMDAYLKEYKRVLNELLEKFRQAPGIVPYVVHINHNESLAAEHDVPMVDKGYFDSAYNHPDVLSKGRFSPDRPPVKEAEKGEQGKDPKDSSTPSSTVSK